MVKVQNECFTELLQKNVILNRYHTELKLDLAFLFSVICFCMTAKYLL